MGIDQYIDQVVQGEIDNNAKSRPEDFAKLQAENPERIEKFRADRTAYWNSVAVWCVNKDQCLSHWKRGSFSERNQQTRKIFQFVTGIDLPRTKKGTDAVIRSYLGESFVAEYEAKQEAERQRQDAERQAKKDAAQATYIAGIETAIRENRAIGGADLLNLARHVGIDVHPRTAGLLKSRVVWIRNDQASITGKGNAGLAFLIYRQVRSKLTTQSV